MPIYEYECMKCGEIKEVMQKCSDKPLFKCKRCSGKLQKLVSQSTFHLKGTGWYVTDYANKSENSYTSQKKKEEKSAATTDNSNKTANKTS